MDALRGKMIEFNGKAPSNLQLEEDQINQLVNLGKLHQLKILLCQQLAKSLPK